jgi:hypothetical protein
VYTLAPDEKATLIMAYTENSLIRGHAVTKKSLRVSTWMRTDGAPEYIHMLETQIISFAGGTVKTFNYNEIYLPAGQMVAYHLAPPQDNPPDYDPNELNRVMESISFMVGTFVFQGKIRVSASIELGASIAMARIAWMSFYELEISNPYLSQMGVIQVPMILARPERIMFAL